MRPEVRTDYGPPAGHRLPEAVRHGRSGSRRLRQSDARPIAVSPRRRRLRKAAASPSLGRRTYQKGLQTLVWRADDDNDDELSYDVLFRREGTPAWNDASPRRDGTDSRVGHDDGAQRHLLHQDRRVRRTVESGQHRAHRRARERGVRNRQHAARHLSHRRGSTAAGRSCRST